MLIIMFVSLFMVHPVFAGEYEGFTADEFTKNFKVEVIKGSIEGPGSGIPPGMSFVHDATVHDGAVGGTLRYSSKNGELLTRILFFYNESSYKNLGKTCPFSSIEDFQSQILIFDDKGQSCQVKVAKDMKVGFSNVDVVYVDKPEGTEYFDISTVGPYSYYRVSCGQIHTIVKPNFTLSETEYKMSANDDSVVVDGTVTKLPVGAKVEYKLNSRSWANASTYDESTGKFSISLSKIDVPYKTNVVSVRVLSKDDVCSDAQSVSVINESGSGTGSGDDPSSGDDPGPGGTITGDGMIDISMDIGTVLGTANDTVNPFMGLIMLIVGIALGFRIVRFIINLF